ncbi:MAG: ChuX/HutX family heme-like substrate-binding protein [Gemmataceae bacterium]
MSRPPTPEQVEAIRTSLAERPSQMTMQLARRVGVPEVEVIRLLPDGRSVELDVGRWKELFEAFAELGQVHVIVSNGSVTCEVVGEFGGFSVWEEFFNVQSKSLDLHIRWPRLAAAFAVEKPSHMDAGRTLSVQLFDDNGDSALKVFLNFGGKPSAEREQQFASLKDRFARR